MTVESTRHRITAYRWEVGATEFDVRTDFNAILAEYGPGVHGVAVWALPDGEEVIVTEYSLFRP